MNRRFECWCVFAASLTWAGAADAAESAAPLSSPPEPPPITLKPYGFIRLDTIYDTAEMNHPQSPIFVDRQPPGITPGGQFSMHPRLTRVGLQLSADDIGGGISGAGKVEIDFQNGGRESRALPRMRHAFVEWSRGPATLLFGQTWQTVSRLFPLANADTLMWGAGNTGDRSPQLRLSYKLALAPKTDLTLETAAQMMGTINDAGQAGLNFGDVPAIQARLALSTHWWAKPAASVAIGVHYGHQEVTEKLVGRQVFEQRGVFGELSLPILDELTLRGEAFLGANLADLRGGIGLGINPVRDRVIHTYGMWAEIVAEPLPWLTLALGGGRDNPNNADLELGQPSQNQTGWGVVHVKPWKSTRVGLEHSLWATHFKGEASATSHRTNLHLQWEF